tara:strand:- start:3625 stop:4458 length:834 start_codon:yes stop_codon:yes gene_type:complete
LRTDIFIHIPKAAGSTLTTILDREYDPSLTYTIEGDIEQSIRKFVSLSSNYRDKIKLLRGHIPYGLHRHINRSSKYFTMMRNPEDRIISYYHYVLRSKDHYLHDEVVGGKMSLNSFIKSQITLELDNDQTRHLSGLFYDIPFGKITEDILEVAKRNIDKDFLIVGLSEKFDESLLLMKKFLNWRHLPLYVRKNVTKNRPETNTFNSQDLNLIREYNSFDVQLYSYAAKKFEDKVEQEYKEIKRDLKLFLGANILYQRIEPKVRKIKRTFSQEFFFTK